MVASSQRNVRGAFGRLDRGVVVLVAGSQAVEVEWSWDAGGSVWQIRWNDFEGARLI